MGAVLSSMFTNPNGFMSSIAKPNLGDLPESLVALIVAHLDPPDICKLGKLNRAFRGASWADFIWESKLPSNYQLLIETLFDPDNFPESITKREIYARLCRFNSVDGDDKIVWLDKNTGGVCFSLSSKALTITGIDDRRYWNHINTEESRFHYIAYLQQIWWFEVGGEFEFPFPAGTYGLFFRLQLGKTTARRFGRQVCDTKHVHGWDVKPVQFQLWSSDGQHASSQCFLNETGKWKLYHVGDFVVGDSQRSMRFKFSLMQIDCTHTKGGLSLDSVLVYPRALNQKLKLF